MIKLVLCAHDPEALTSIEEVPTAALEIVKQFEPLFDESSVFDNGLWTEFSDLPKERFEQLCQRLNDEGYECEIVPNHYA